MVTLVALLPALAIAVSSVVTLQRDQTAALHDAARRTADLLSLDLEQTVAGVESVLRTLAAAPVTKRGAYADCSAMLSEAVNALAYLAALAIVNDDGSVRCSSEPDRTRTAGPLPGFVRQTLETGKLTTGTATDGQDFRPHRLPIALRIWDDGSMPPAVAIAYLDIDWLGRRLDERWITPGGSLTIADRTGMILARNPEPERFVGTFIPEDYRRLVKAGEAGTEEMLSQDGTRRIIGYVPPATNASGLYISAGVSTDVGYATLRTIATNAALLTLAGTLLALILTYSTARVFIAKPVGLLISTIAAWRAGDTTARTGLSDRDGEIGGAGQSLDFFLDEILANREARQRADDARDLMRDELEHREKNLLATVQAIARQTFPQAGNETAFQNFSSRLSAISEANRLLKQSNWHSTALRDLVANSVAPFVGPQHNRVCVTGPDLVVKGNVATAIGMSIHELCTNAVKYGALGNDSGTVSINWKVKPSGSGEMFTLHWVERGGPLVRKPERTGFGSKVIKHALSAQTGGTVEIRYNPEGLEFQLTAPVGAILASTES